MTLQPGEILASKYRIDGVLGVGGMGTVLAATHLELEQRVAIKVPHAQQVKDATFAARFMREGKNAAKIRSDHVARVVDVGRTDDGAPFLVMEYLDGYDLSQRLKAVGRLPIADGVDIVLQACDAVAAAHAVGIVHRDLKPANLFLEQGHDGAFQVKVLDFGISKVLADDPAALEAALTNTTGVVGSPMYMSPEQMVAARNVDTRTDVWSLGLILYKCVTGRTPWPSGNVIELAARIAKDPPIPPSTFVPEVPPALEEAILHCLEKERERRTSSALELAIAIAPFDPGRGEHTLRRIRRAAAPPSNVSVPSLSMPVEPGTLATSAITLHTDGIEEVEVPRPSSPAWKRTERLIMPIPVAEPYTDATTGPAERASGSSTRMFVVVAVVAVALIIGLVALVSTPSRPASVAAPKSTEITIAAPTIAAPPPAETAVEVTPPASTSAAPIASTTVPPAKAPPKGAPKLKEWDGPATPPPPKPAKSSGDPWGAW
jgi:eukaryotic-like serine/threonine-protein kinase